MILKLIVASASDLSVVSVVGNVPLEFKNRSSKSKALQGNSGLDVVLDGQLTVKGFARLRKTKLVCTIGLACSSLEELENLATGGMNVARSKVNSLRPRARDGLCLPLRTSTKK